MTTGQSGAWTAERQDARRQLRAPTMPSVACPPGKPAAVSCRPCRPTSTTGRPRPG